MGKRLVLLGAALMLSLGSITFAQDEGGAPTPPPSAPSSSPEATSGSGGSMNIFQMFFSPIPKDPNALDWFGVIQIYGLILLSVVALAIIIKAWMKNRKENIIPGGLVTDLQQMMAEKRFKEAVELAASDPSYFAKLIQSSIAEASNGFAAMERAMQETADHETTRMLRPLEVMNILGNVAPMLGLFGTVYGMIVAFMRLVEAGGKPDPGELAGGISTALVTTFWGLIIAMPCLAAYAVIRNRVDEYTTEGVLLAEEVLKPLRPGKKGAAPAKPAATPAKKPEGEA